jgi:hypothetical protein
VNNICYQTQKAPAMEPFVFSSEFLGTYLHSHGSLPQVGHGAIFFSFPNFIGESDYD